MHSIRITCTSSVDGLLSPLPTPWMAEFYGNQSLLHPLLHRSIACLSREGVVAVALVQEFGGLDAPLLSRYARALGGSVGNVIVSRAFKLESVPALLDTVPPEARSVVAVDPYLYAPTDPKKYWEATPVTAGLRRLVAERGLNLLVFNRPTRLGGRGLLPEGGNFHHHTPHALVRVTPCPGGGGVRMTLVKHAWRKTPLEACVKPWEVSVSWAAQSPLPA